MSSPRKSFLIEDILSNKYEVIPSSAESNRMVDLLSTKVQNDRYHSNNINLPVHPLPTVLKETLDKSNINTVGQERSSNFAHEFRRRKSRKIRAAFTTYQIYALENWFSHQRYLTPSDRDQIATELRLSTGQVVTWFQNRRAKLKRHYKQLKNSINATENMQAVEKLIDFL